MSERSVGRPWTAEEDELLARAVGEHGENDNWKRVALCVPGRTNKACRKRWLHSLSPSVKKTAWTSEEDRRLVELYGVHAGKWALIAKQIPGRTDDACSKRYREALDPLLKKGEWTAEEDAKLLEAYKQLGGKWGQVGHQLQRSGLACRNRWRLLERKSKLDPAHNLCSPSLNMPAPPNSYNNWDPATAPFRYSSSSLSAALHPVSAADTANFVFTPSYPNMPSMSTSPPVEFDAPSRPYDRQLHRDEYYIPPAPHTDRPMSSPSSWQTDCVTSLQRSDLFYHSVHHSSVPPSPAFQARDRPCNALLQSHPPNHDLHPVSHTSQPPQDSGPSPDHFYPAASSQPLVHRTAPMHSKSSPYPKPLDPPPTPAQDEQPPRRHRARPSIPRKRPDAQAPLRLSSDLPATSDPSIKPYACGHESCWPANATTSCACFSTSRGLSDHNKSVHPHDSGGDRPYRCGLEGCGKSWKSINGLQYHLQISKAHFQHAITSTYLTPYIGGLSVPASVETSTSSAPPESKKRQYKCPHENCPNRYKQLSGLRYHLAHGHPSDLPAQLALVPPALSRKLEEKMRARAQPQGSAPPQQASLSASTSGLPQQALQATTAMLPIPGVNVPHSNNGAGPSGTGS